MPQPGGPWSWLANEAQGEAGVGKAREPHTVYLRPELWAALDSRHLELRLSGQVSDSKIEFVEQVLEAGLGLEPSGPGSSRTVTAVSGCGTRVTTAPRGGFSGRPSSRMSRGNEMGS